MARRSNRNLIPNLRQTAAAAAAGDRARQAGQAGQPGQPGAQGVPAVPGTPTAPGAEPVRRFGGRRGVQRAAAQISGTLGDLRTQLADAGFQIRRPGGRRAAFLRGLGAFSFTAPDGSRGSVSPFGFASPRRSLTQGGGGGGLGPRGDAGRFGVAPFGFGPGAFGFGPAPGQPRTFIAATPRGFEISAPTRTSIQTVPFSTGAQGVVEALLAQRAQAGTPADPRQFAQPQIL